MNLVIQVRLSKKQLNLYVVVVEWVSDFFHGQKTSDRCNFLFGKFQNMGLLSEGSPLSWEETKALAEHVRQHGIEQFINIYHRYKDICFDVLKWGDEVSLYFLNRDKS